MPQGAERADDTTEMLQETGTSVAPLRGLGARVVAIPGLAALALGYFPSLLRGWRRPPTTDDRTLNPEP